MQIKLLLLFLLAISIGPAKGQKADAGKEALRPFVLQWGFVHMPPLVSLDESGQAKGRLAELLAGVSDITGTRFEPIILPNARAIFNLNEHKVNFAIGMKSIVKKGDEFLFSTLPVAQLQLQVVWQKGTAAITTIDDLTNKNLVLLAGYTYGGLRVRLTQMASSYLEVENHDRAIRALELAQGKYALIYKAAGDVIFEQNDDENFESLILNDIPLFFILDQAVPNAQQLMLNLEEGFLEYQRQMRSNFIKAK